MAQCKGKKKRFSTLKIVVYSIATVILLVSWLASPPGIVKIGVGIYVLYRFFKWASGGFGCPVCMTHFGVASLIGVLVMGILPAYFYILAIGGLWLEPFL